jgi:hypothetical protein
MDLGYRVPSSGCLIRDRDSKLTGVLMPCSPARACVSCTPRCGTPGEDGGFILHLLVLLR